MRAKGLWVAGVAALAGVAFGCGPGHAIFNVDVYSFIKGTGKDTVPYVVPPGATVTASQFQKIHLPGAGGSLVDSITIFGTDTLRNQTGSGTVGFQLFVAADSAGTYLPGALALTVTPKAVANSSVVPDTIRGTLAPGVNPLFTKDTLWVRLAAAGSNPPPSVTPLTGKMVLASLLLSVVINLKVL
jgi:hypothetical protein